jgi:beta-phosphoglucomutase-like phosphatase (HAD superfamily)
MKKLEAVLFDLDGVLVDACDWHYEALNEALEICGYDVITKEDHLKKFNGLPTRVKLNMFGVNEKDTLTINKLKQKNTLKIIKNNSKIMFEKIELHQYLKSCGYKIGCVTNSIKETAIEMLKSTGQLNYIDILVTNEDVLNNKPSPECYNFAINKLNFSMRNRNMNNIRRNILFFLLI